ncbi:MAG TPA: peptidylprolyl isomerase [Pyrinomonadaceae bacterium]|nr:peptidylprolyl isomerase [Pyrinomonadaceae bacterium]
MPARKLPMRIFFLLTLCLLYSSCASNDALQTKTSDGSLPPVVATVNGQEISTKFYEMYLKNGKEALALDPSTDEGRKKVEQLREGIVSELIDRALIAQEAQRRSLTIAPDKLATAEQRAIQQFGGEQKYDEYLNGFRLSRTEYLEVIKSELYGELMRTELSKDLSVSEKEISDYYEAQKAEPNFQQPERITASHILIAARANLIERQLREEKNLSGDSLATAVREEMAARRRRAEDLRRKAASGTDFAKLARESSDDPGTREAGGSLGTFTRDTHAKAFDEAAFKLRAGSVSDVVETEYGFHIIKVFARETARARTLAEMTPEIRARLLAKRQAEELTKWLKESRRKATVRVNEPFRFGALKTEFAGS